MSKRLTAKKLRQMFAAYCERPSVYHVAAKCKVSPTTAKRYRDAEDWDGRLKQISRKAAEKVDRKVVDVTAENLRVVRFAKARVVRRIRNGKVKSSSTYSDLDRLVRLEQFLSGGNDSRPDVEITELRSKSTGELRALLRQLRRGRT